jgi:hypothetical protein
VALAPPGARCLLVQRDGALVLEGCAPGVKLALDGLAFQTVTQRVSTP